MEHGAWNTLDDLGEIQGLVLFFRGRESLTPDLWHSVNDRYRSLPRQRIEARGFEGKLGDILVLDVLADPGVTLFLVGLEDKDRPLTWETVRRSGGALASTLTRQRMARVAVAVPDLENDALMCARVFYEGLRLGQYRFDRYKRDDSGTPVEHLVWHGIDLKAWQAHADEVEVLVAATCLARDLVNEPALELTPLRFEEVAREIARQHGLEIRVYDEVDLEKMGAGAFLSVARGSDNPPRMIHLHYCGSGPVLGLVGKGITFDSGGLSLKTTRYMLDMKGDMAGAAAVLATMQAVAQLGPNAEVHGVLCCAENMPSGRASRPGDVVRALNGKTIEITNTDAEGRLVLADGLVYTARQGAQQLIDVATLTGAAVVALGTKIAGVLARDQELANAFLAAAEKTGEAFWPLPLEPAYRSLLDSKIANIKNSSNNSEAGTILGGLFLREFTEDRPWLHLDIAGPFWLEKPFYYMPEGGTGFGVRTLVQYVRDQAEQAAR